MHRFVGFGSPTAALWFVGLEQGGGESLAELERRLTTWEHLNKETFADLRDYCLRLGELRWHGESPPHPADPRQARPTRARGRGDFADDRCGSQLPGTSVWPLERRNRHCRTDASAESQCLALDLFSAHRCAWAPYPRGVLAGISPQAPSAPSGRHPSSSAPRVVFLGLSEAQTWAEIADAPYTQGPEGVQWTRSGSTRFAILKHPTAFGAKNAYFENIGRELAA
jgi:hypothetical protein